MNKIRKIRQNNRIFNCLMESRSYTGKAALFPDVYKVHNYRSGSHL
jgi:hypothetical protein